MALVEQLSLIYFFSFCKLKLPQDKQKVKNRNNRDLLLTKLFFLNTYKFV